MREIIPVICGSNKMEEYHYELGKGLLLFPIRFLPFILGGLTLFLIGAEMGGV